MPLVSIGEMRTNINEKTEAYEFLKLINKHYGYEKIVVTETFCQDGGFFTRKVFSYFSIYIKISEVEYQHMMSFKRLDLQDVESYLLGYINGLGI